MCIYQRQYTKALSNLTVGCEFHYVIRRTVQCFADLTHGFNRDIFISGHFENDIVADTRSLFRVFLFHIPADQQFPELFYSLYPCRRPQFKQVLPKKQEQSALAL